MSKKQFQQRMYLAYVIILLPVLLVACVATSTSNTSSPIGFWGFLTSPLAQAIGGAFIAGLAAMLPYIQLRLKAMPTTESVKIKGYLGLVLDILTWWQKDILKVAKPVALTLDSTQVQATITPETESVKGPAIGSGPVTPGPVITVVQAKTPLTAPGDGKIAIGN